MITRVGELKRPIDADRYVNKLPAKMACFNQDDLGCFGSSEWIMQSQLSRTFEGGNGKDVGKEFYYYEC